MNDLKKCKLCPRNCKVNRYKNKGFCKANNKLKVALASMHNWEEPCISGDNGSGTIFFSYCNLRCVYCQNYEISNGGYGKYISIKRFSHICLELQKKKVNNINLVTPTHYVSQIIKGIKLAKEKGLSIPIVYNTSGYESIETIKKLNNIIDIYLTDFKYYNDEYASKYSNVSDYVLTVKAAIRQMYSQIGNPEFNYEGIMNKGIIVRILLLPGLLDDAKKIIKYLYSTYGDNIYISIMNQYTPVRETKYPELNQKVNESDYEELIDYAYNLGVRCAFVQENGTVSESFIPKFDKRGV
ncbi:MAG: radical SAM protein [bacterium]|nr:radical SAM protein [bacterium]